MDGKRQAPSPRCAPPKHWNLRIPSKESINQTCQNLWGFKLDDLTSFDRFVNLLYRPADPASLGVARALFGLCMVIDVMEERGFSDIDLKWGDTTTCHFPLLHGLKPLKLAHMIVLYTIMWAGAFGIMLGLYFRLACACFVIPYWYILILDKTFWNNHSYLYGIIAILFWGSGANRYLALDSRRSKTVDGTRTVPLWNYFILKYQFFLLYFLAGLKKFNREWLEGYSMTNLSQHWVFDPFKFFLTTEQTDFFIVHWFGFIFDLTVGFWLLFDKTRMPAIMFSVAFHLMNSRLFAIGMFPYVCLATMGLFCHASWPRQLLNLVKGSDCKKDDHVLEGETTRKSGTRGLSGTSDRDFSATNTESSGRKQQDKHSSHENSKRPRSSHSKTINAGKPRKTEKLVILLLFLHMGLQLFLPYSHFITRGYNNWVSGLYGYSWDMMVHNWDTILVVVRVHDNDSNEDHFVDHQAWVQNEKWSKHPDMMIQYAQCLKEQLMRRKQEVLQLRRETKALTEWSRLSSNLSIYIDVRCSLNGRFQQRMFDPNVDLLKVDWHPLKPASFLMPLLTQYSSYRQKMETITQDVYTWSNYTDVLFVADYPGMDMENYFSGDFSNISLTVLEGQVTYSEEDWENKVTVDKGHGVPVTPEKLHLATTISAYPSCYMYTFTNQTKETLARKGISEPPRKRIGFPIWKEIEYKISALCRTLDHIGNAFFYLVYNVPMLRRVPHQPNHEDLP